MSDLAIQVENLSKAYQLGDFGTGALTRDIHRWWMLMRGHEDPYLKIGEANDRAVKGTSDIVWSLKDINFEIKEGDAVGIIGRNGAGKSTLLKILSRVTAPTTGNIKVKGRIASLLEVGTGFHPELTGGENIYLNGAIMGMSKREIKRKFDEIVDFAGVDRYIDTPVKRYSSGMYVRLAFAVAAYLDSEILVVDEVLAVGDAEFQKKCLGKMNDVSKGQGRTVLFVSHNMAAVKALCDKGIVLKNGLSAFSGTAAAAIKFYQDISNFSSTVFEHVGPLSEAPGNDAIRILNFKITPEVDSVLSVSSGINFELQFYSSKENINLDVTFELKTHDEIPVFHNGTIVTQNKESQKGIYKVKGTLPRYLINAGTYKFKIIFGENQRYLLYVADDFIQFEIVNEVEGGGNSDILPGVLRLKIPFEIEFKDTVQL